jgi:hypothetical protein
MALLAEGRALAWMAVRVMVELHSFEEPHAKEGRSAVLMACVRLERAR